MEELNISVAASSDDAYGTSGTGEWDYTTTTHRYGRPPKVAWGYEPFQRFALTMATGSTVNTATLRLYNKSAAGTAQNYLIQCSNERDSAALTARPGSMLATSIAQVIPSSLTADAWWETDDFATVLNGWMQATLSGRQYQQNDHVTIGFDWQSSGFSTSIPYFEAVDAAAGHAPILHLLYTPPGAGFVPAWGGAFNRRAIGTEFSP